VKVDMPQSPLQRLHARFGDVIDDEMEACLQRARVAEGFAGMMRYQLGHADESLRRQQPSGGKRFRPLLCLLGCEAAGGDWRRAIPAAAAIELLHNFSLIHDDIEDLDPVRRHRPTVWKLWGEPQAINVGDGMFALSGLLALQSEPADPGVALDVAVEFQRTALTLTQGQYMDMSFEQRDEISADEYFTMIDGKSAAIIAFALWAGAAIAGATAPYKEAFREFGMYLGRAFQIHDDVLGISASRDRTGKEVGMDVSNRKKTLPVILAMAEAEGEAKRVLQHYYARQSDDAEAVLKILRDLRSDQRALWQASHLLESAFGALSSVDLPRQSRSDLHDLARELTGLQGAAGS
jgi:geranylgeranyl diphosphate synthase type I